MANEFNISYSKKQIEGIGFVRPSTVSAPTYQILSNYDHLFPIGYKTKTEDKGEGTTEGKTIPTIREVAQKYAWQTKKLAEHLYSPDKEQAAFNVWHFHKNNYKYKFDNARAVQRAAGNAEVIRTPLQSYLDRFDGIDCEDFTVSIYTTLQNMGYKEAEKNIVAFDGSASYGHIFATLPPFVLDPCPPLERFNEIAPNITKTMRIYVKGAGINGIGKNIDVSPITSKITEVQKRILADKNMSSNSRNRELRKLIYIKTLNNRPEDQEIAVKIMPFIKDISKNGNFIFKEGVKPEEVGKYATMLDLKQQGVYDLLKNTGVGDIDELGSITEDITSLTDQKTIGDAVSNRINNAFDNLKNSLENESQEAEFEKALETELEAQINGVGKLKIKKFTQKVKEKAKNFVENPKQAIKNTVKQVKEQVKQAVKNPIHTLVRLIPGSALLRKAFILAMSVNFMKVAKKLYTGYLTEKEAIAKGLDITEWQKVKKLLEKASKIYFTAGGKEEVLKETILKWASRKGVSGADDLGEAVTAASVAAAVAPLTAILAQAKELGIDFKKLFKNNPEEAKEAEETTEDTKQLEEAEKEARKNGYGVDMAEATKNDATLTEEENKISQEAFKKTDAEKAESEKNANDSNNKGLYIMGSIGLALAALIGYNALQKPKKANN